MFSRVLASFLCLSLVGLVLACQDTNERKNGISGALGGGSANCGLGGDANPAIFGGRKADRTSWLARQLVIIVADQSICTASLVDRNIILTAAHCIPKSRDPKHLRVIFTPDPVCESRLGKDHVMEISRQASEMIVHPSWGRSGTENGDLAMVRIEGVAPEAYQLVTLLNHPLPLLAETRVLLAGYGVMSDFGSQDKNDPYDLKYAHVSPFAGGGPKSLRQLQDSDEIWWDQTRGEGACSGDSGGPAFMLDEYGQYRQMGVASRVDSLNGPEFTDDTRTCKIGLVHTNVLYHRTWIESTFQQLRTSDSTRTTLF